MGYIKAEGILPIEIKELIQQYVDGKSIYIPSKSSHRQAWGTGTRMKQELLRRDRQIYEDYLAGSRTEELAGKCSILAEMRICKNTTYAAGSFVVNGNFRIQRKIRLGSMEE